MTVENWHTDFNPKRFLSRVNLAQLIQRNEAYNESVIKDANTACVLCRKRLSTGILLNDKSFLCQDCYSEAALITYPQKYEKQHRDFVVSVAARNLALKEFTDKYQYIFEESSLVPLGWASVILFLVHPAFLLLSFILVAAGCEKNHVAREKRDEWLKTKSQWERENPVPLQPILKHFHDPSAELTERDRQILKIFDHWPGYPPFWDYLRTVVLTRDGHRCQVTGCPSRLELHVHHRSPVAKGGTHAPSNLVSLCSFHHALEPDKGHERIWGNIKTQYFTMVCSHERSYRATNNSYQVSAHLRRLELIKLDELRSLVGVYGFCCPDCKSTKLKITLFSDKNLIRVECPNCTKSTEVAQQLTEETGPTLAAVLCVTRNQGTWSARWDMLAERKEATWGAWSGQAISAKRKKHKEKIERNKDIHICPKCGAPMKLIVPHKTTSWKPFWGCTQYPVTGCKGSKRNID